jgi:hypothetical protein
MQLLTSRKRARPLFLLAALAATTFGLTACGGGDDGPPAAALPASTPQTPGPTTPGQTAATPSGANPLPSIAGTPPTSTLEGKVYSFTPATNPAAPGPLAFSIAGKPAWATFNPSTGELTGTPSAADVGVHKNISISVTDGTATTSVLAAWDIEVVAAGAAGGAVTVSWTAPVRNADGTPLTDLAGYRIYWGTSKGDYPNSVTIDNPGITTYVVDQLLPATYYFVIRAVNKDGVESGDSKVGSKTIG